MELLLKIENISKKAINNLIPELIKYGFESEYNFIILSCPKITLENLFLSHNKSFSIGKSCELILQSLITIESLHNNNIIHRDINPKSLIIESKEKKLDEKTSYSYFIQILNAVCFLHLNNIIHRDIKPENILIDKNGNLKLCDFGWSKEIDLEKRSTICGTIEYMAPEIVKSENYDFGVDIWSLGIFLYEMVIGHSPFYSKDIKDIKIKIKEHNIKFDENISFNCMDLIKKLLKGNSEKRFKLKDICNHPFIVENMDNFDFGIIETENMEKENHKINICKRKRSFSLKSLFTENKIEIMKENLNNEIEKAKIQVERLDFKQQNFEFFENIKNLNRKKKKGKCKCIPINKSRTDINTNAEKMKIWIKMIK
jgi:serine/threonine protein kinase